MYSSQYVILFAIFAILFTGIVSVVPVSFPNNHFVIAQASSKTK